MIIRSEAVWLPGSLSKDMGFAVIRIIRQLIKRFIPNVVLEVRRRWLLDRAVSRADRMFAGKMASEIFSEIYRKGLWGRLTNGEQFCSGHGSHMAKHVEPYVKATSDFFSSLGAMPDVVDLGCGDFNVGSRLRPFCAKYVACDVAAPVVEANRKRFAGLDIEFRQLDIIESELPPGDVVLIRQVLQHLSNADIRKIVSKLYNYNMSYWPRLSLRGNLFRTLISRLASVPAWREAW